MGTRIVQVDAFTDRPFAGNPAAVCVLAEPRDDAWMQRVAREMNLSETAFLVRDHDAFRLRWFTPAAEVELCGHATLAAAHVLWTDGSLPAGETARFDTRGGRLTCTRRGEWIEMDFPAMPARTLDEPAAVDAVVAAIGVAPRWVGRNRFDLLVEVDSETAVRAVEPDLRRIAALPARGVIVTAPAAETGPFDFVSRFFAPAVGVDEDPVTGSAHCALAPFWAERLGRDELVGYQASDRGGTVRVRTAGDRVLLAGSAVTVLTAELLA